MSLNDVPPSLRFGAPEFVFEEDHSAGRDPAAAGRSRVSPYQSWVPASPQIDSLSVAVSLQIFQTDLDRGEGVAFAKILFNNKPLATGGLALLDYCSEVEITATDLGHLRNIFSRVEFIILQMNQGYSALQVGNPTHGITSAELDPIRVKFSKELRGVREDVFENQFFAVLRKFESVIVVDQTFAVCGTYLDT